VELYFNPRCPPESYGQSQYPINAFQSSSTVGLMAVRRAGTGDGHRSYVLFSENGKLALKAVRAAA
jgi:hypothetical protein